MATLLSCPRLRDDRLSGSCGPDQPPAACCCSPGASPSGLSRDGVRRCSHASPSGAVFPEPISSPATVPQAVAAPVHLREPLEAVDYNSVHELPASTRHGALSPLSGKCLLGVAEGWWGVGTGICPKFPASLLNRLCTDPLHQDTAAWNVDKTCPKRHSSLHLKWPLTKSDKATETFAASVLLPCRTGGSSRVQCGRGLWCRLSETGGVKNRRLRNPGDPCLRHVVACDVGRAKKSVQTLIQKTRQPKMEAKRRIERTREPSQTGAGLKATRSHLFTMILGRLDGACP